MQLVAVGKRGRGRETGAEGQKNMEADSGRRRPNEDEKTRMWRVIGRGDGASHHPVPRLSLLMHPSRLSSSSPSILRPWISSPRHPRVQGQWRPSNQVHSTIQIPALGRFASLESASPPTHWPGGRVGLAMSHTEGQATAGCTIRASIQTCL